MPPKEPRSIRKVRSEHGTRVARSIVCTACGAKDTIHFAPRDQTKVLCRRCASDLLGVDDPDTKVGSQQPFTCTQCGRTEMTQHRVKTPEEYLCRDCLRGIESNQEDKAKRGTRVSKKVVRVRKPEAED